MTLKKAYLIILVSFAWLIGGAVLFQLINPSTQSASAHLLGWGMLLGFAAIFLVGATVWAGAKGYHPILGFVLGWIGPIGLLILVILPDRSRRSR